VNYDPIGTDIPYVIVKTPAEAVEYVSEFARSCQNRTSYFSHPALQRIMGQTPLDTKNLRARLTIFKGDTNARYYIDLHEHSDTYRGVNLDFTTRNMPSSSMT